jgi:putative ABC transport system permease protein
MNLAFKDTRYHLVKFVSSSVGVSLLLMVVFALGGVIRGVILDSSTIVTATGADLWVVQKDWLGPFVEISRLPEDDYRAIQSLRGVAEASPLVMAWGHVQHRMQAAGLMLFMYENARIGTATMGERSWTEMAPELKFLLVGYAPGHIGGPPMIVAGRDIEASHFEIVVDVKTGLQLGEQVHLADFDYTVVGLTKNMVGFNADPVIYARLEDAQNILFEPDPDLLRNLRRRTGGQVGGAEAVAPRLVQPLMPKASAISENLHMINAIAVRVEPGVPIEEVADEITHWKHLQVYTSARQINMQLMGANRLILMQLSLLRLLLLIIAGVIIGLITYTFTLDKIKDIAVLKLLGTQTRRIYSMILQEAVLMGLVGTVVGAVLEHVSEPYFPRRVSATIGDVWQMLAIITVVSILASLVAIRRAMHVDPRIVLGT